MVFTAAHEFLHSKGVFAWTPALQQEYRSLSVEQKDALRSKARMRTRPIPTLRAALNTFAKDLAQHDVSFVVITVGKDGESNVMCSPDAASVLTSGPASEACSQIIRKMRECRQTHSQAQSDLDQSSTSHIAKRRRTTGGIDCSSNKSNLNVHSLRKELMTMTKSAFCAAGCHGPIPWKAIETDKKEGLRRASGFFVPEMLTSPLSLSVKQCNDISAKIQENGGLRFHKWIQVQETQQEDLLQTVLQQPPTSPSPGLRLPIVPEPMPDTMVALSSGLRVPEAQAHSQAPVRDPELQNSSLHAPHSIREHVAEYDRLAEDSKFPLPPANMD